MEVQVVQWQKKPIKTKFINRNCDQSIKSIYCPALPKICPSVFEIKKTFLLLLIQCVDRGRDVCCHQLHGHRGYELFIQLRVRLLEGVQIPLSAGLCKHQQHGPYQPPVSQRRDTGR